jgi:hypothetical protein
MELDSSSSSNSENDETRNKKQKFKYALFSKKFLVICLLALSISCKYLKLKYLFLGYPYLFSNLNYLFGMSYFKPDFVEKLRYLLIFYNIVGNIVWGGICDLISIKSVLYVKIYLSVKIT